MPPTELGTHQKALAIKLDQTISASLRRSAPGRKCAAPGSDAQKSFQERLFGLASVKDAIDRVGELGPSYRELAVPTHIPQCRAPCKGAWRGSQAMTTTTGESVLRNMNIAPGIAPSIGRFEKGTILISSDRRAQPAHRSRDMRTRAAAKQGDVLQEALLVSRKQLFRVAFRILKNEEDAEDAVQDATISAFRHFDAFGHRAQITTWLTRIVVNASLMIHRKRKSGANWSLQESMTDETVLADTIPDHQPNPESAYQRVESLTTIDSVLNEMNPLLSSAIKATYYDELSRAEASAALAVSISAFKARLSRGTRLLQKKVRRKTNNFLKMR